MTQPHPDQITPGDGDGLLSCPCCKCTDVRVSLDRSIFAGQTYVDEPGDEGWKVHCEKCGLQTCWWHKEEQAIDAWNTRATRDAAEGAGEIPEHALWALISTLHSNVPEDDRPMSWSDFSDEQAIRLKQAAGAFLKALGIAPPKPAPEVEWPQDAPPLSHPELLGPDGMRTPSKAELKQAFFGDEQPAPDAMWVQVEDIAQWLHDETSHPEAYPNHTWPETERDDGQREGGFVKIVPMHGQEYFRDIARRLIARFFSAPVPLADGTGDIRAIVDQVLYQFENDGRTLYPDNEVIIAIERIRSALPSGAGAAEPVSDERALELALQICTGKLSAVQGAIEIMQYATDGVLQIQAATPPVRGG